MQEKVTINGIVAVIHRPKRETGELAILCPGYLDTKDYTGLAMLAEELANRGYTAVRFDPTGTWESAGTIEQYNTTQYLADVRLVLEHFLKEKSYQHVLLGGHSRGGFISILYAAKDPRVSAVLAIMPSSSESSQSKTSLSGERGERWKATGFETSWRDIPGSLEKRKFEVPYAHVVDRSRYNSTAALKAIRAPIAFIAGEDDDIILPEDVKRMFDIANEPKSYAVVPNVGHDYRHSAPEVREVNNVILAKLAEMHV